MNIRFLERYEIVAIHDVLIDRFGGSYGLRDESLLDSAINFPQVTFLDNYLHQDIFAMAASYSLSIIKNHAFVIGNKRTGITIAVLFLVYNGVKINLMQEELFELAISIATSQLDLPRLAEAFRKASRTD